MPTAIEFHHVWKKYKKGEKFNSIRDAVPNFIRNMVKKPNEDTLQEREFWAVNDVSFDIKKGSVTGIMGPNGAGKSTVLKLLSRIIIPNKGEIKIHGRVSALIEVTAGFHPELTGRENIYLNGTILGMRRREIDNKLDQIIEFSGVREFIDTPVKRYSSGMYSRLGFSVAAHMDPEILLVDEVLSVGDISFQAKCAQKMRELMRSGATIVLVSHHLSLIQSLCQRAILLYNGEVVEDGHPDDVIPEYENLVFRKKEDEFKQRIESNDAKVKLDTKSIVEISHVSFANQDGISKQSFDLDDDITMTASFNSREKILEPVCILEISRPDGVLCCSSSTGDLSDPIPSINGKGIMKVHLGKLRLAPGIYSIKLAVWDRDMIHPYVIRTRDILRFENREKGSRNESVFVPAIDWKVSSDASK